MTDNNNNNWNQKANLLQIIQSTMASYEAFQEW